jgi:hypothetical protein
MPADPRGLREVLFGRNFPAARVRLQNALSGQSNTSNHAVILAPYGRAHEKAAAFVENPHQHAIDEFGIHFLPCYTIGRVSAMEPWASYAREFGEIGLKLGILKEKAGGA